MNRAEIIILAASLAKSLHDVDTLDTYINDVFHILGTLPKPQMVESYLKEITSGTSAYSYESDMLSIAYAIMYDELLSQCDERHFDAYSDTWQSETGTPTQFAQDSQTAREYRLYPEPNFSSSALIPAHGEPFGEDYPSNILTLIYADDREDNIPDIYSLPIAHDALSREFLQPSDHTDINYAALCSNIAQLFYRLLEVI